MNSAHVHFIIWILTAEWSGARSCLGRVDDVTVFPVHTRKQRFFQIAPLWRAFSNGSVSGDRFRSLEPHYGPGPRTTHGPVDGLPLRPTPQNKVKNKNKDFTCGRNFIYCRMRFLLLGPVGQAVSEIFIFAFHLILGGGPVEGSVGVVRGPSP